MGNRIIIIDDEQDFLDSIARGLFNNGCMDVRTVCDSAKATIFFLQEQASDIELIDYRMPRMKSWDTLVALRKLSPDIPAILSSGYDEAQVMADDHTERPNAFLGKPYQLKGLEK